MGFQQAVTVCFSKYLGFQGRAARPEYWWWVLFVVAGSVVLQVLDALLFGGSPGVFSGLFGLATLLPGIAVSVRRLHDLDKSGWWLAIVLIPVVGALVLLYFMVQAGTNGPNRFDEAPSGYAA